jgi:hypothetical protein
MKNGGMTADDRYEGERISKREVIWYSTVQCSRVSTQETQYMKYVRHTVSTARAA